MLGGDAGDLYVKLQARVGWGWLWLGGGVGGWLRGQRGADTLARGAGGVHVKIHACGERAGGGVRRVGASSAAVCCWRELGALEQALLHSGGRRPLAGARPFRWLAPQQETHPCCTSAPPHAPSTCAPPSPLPRPHRPRSRCTTCAAASSGAGTTCTARWLSACTTRCWAPRCPSAPYAGSASCGCRQVQGQAPWGGRSGGGRVVVTRSRGERVSAPGGRAGIGQPLALPPPRRASPQTAAVLPPHPTTPPPNPCLAPLRGAQARSTGRSW